MTVKELREILKDAPDDMRVCVDAGSTLGMFVFVNACVERSGIADIGEPEDGEFGMAKGGQVFVILAHGATVTEDELGKECNKLPPEVFN